MSVFFVAEFPCNYNVSPPDATMLPHATVITCEMEPWKCNGFTNELQMEKENEKDGCNTECVWGGLLAYYRCIASDIATIDYFSYESNTFPTPCHLE